MSDNKNLKLKVCGMRESENILALAKLLPDYMGFIFYGPSKRYAGDLLNKDTLKTLPESIVKTGVFVNEGVEGIEKICLTYGLKAVQLHGNETPEECAILQASGLQVIKVLHVDKAMQIDEMLKRTTLDRYEKVCDYFLFDTADMAWGGTGRTFDWNILKDYSSQKPFFLSGGIGLEQLPIPGFVLEKPIWGIDINSRFEISPGLKDIERIKLFKEKLNAVVS
ncbi:MAG TPA: phosphoribosylanthranilate isomerase [Cytophagaceae bacterium]|jgi:phosphoribosylanthranilate isomerase|nr:phosphoribosylanthranilate isomerase [Cytophagaceae bacterium]